MLSHLILDSDLDGNLCAITLDAAEDSAKGTNAEAILFMEVIRRLSRDPKQKRKQSFSRPRIGTRLDDLESRILRKTAQNISDIIMMAMTTAFDKGLVAIR